VGQRTPVQDPSPTAFHVIELGRGDTINAGGVFLRGVRVPAMAGYLPRLEKLLSGRLADEFTNRWRLSPGRSTITPKSRRSGCLPQRAEHGGEPGEIYGVPAMRFPIGSGHQPHPGFWELEMEGRGRLSAAAQEAGRPGGLIRRRTRTGPGRTWCGRK